MTVTAHSGNYIDKGIRLSRAGLITEKSEVEIRHKPYCNTNRNWSMCNCDADFYVDGFLVQEGRA